MIYFVLGGSCLGSFCNSVFGLDIYICTCPEMGVSHNGWFIMDNPIKVDDLGDPFFRKPPYIYIYIHTHGINPL